MKNNLQNLSDEQRRKILAAAEIVDGGDMAVVKKIIEFDDTIETATEKIDEFGNKIDETITEAKTKISETIDNAKKEFESIKEQIDVKLSEVEDGETPSEEDLKSIIIPLIPKVKDGRTPTKKELIDLIKPLIPEPVNGENPNPEDVVPLVIKKLPPVTFDDRQKIVEKINSGKKNDTKIEASQIEGIATQKELDRAIGILDRRTQFLINKPTGTSGSTTFIGLTDVPATYAGSALKVLRVNAGETALEFTTLAGGGDALKADPLSQFASTTSLQLAGVISDETGSGALVFGTDPTFTTRINVPEIKATGSGGIDLHNNSGTQIAILGAGGGIGTSINGTTNIGSASADYIQIAGGTGATTLTATGSSTNIDITAVPKGAGLFKITGNLQISGLTASTILVTDASKNVISASTSTYPSLTELAYVKGVTSAIQTQLDAKQPLDSDLTTIAGLTPTTDNFIQSKAGAWASRTPTQVTADLIAFVGDSGSGGSKGLVPAPAIGDSSKFLKGDGTWATVSGSGDVSKVGTPINNQMAVWTGDGTLEGTSDFTYDGTSLNLITGKNFQIAGATILADSTGTTTLSNIDALDATTESTIESAIDTLPNLTSIQGLSVTLADAGANAIFGWDDTAGAYENLTQGEARTVLGLATSDSPQFTDINLGHASDTTLARVSAGVVSIEGVNIVTISSTDTLTNKRITKRVVTAADATSVTPNSDNADWTYQSNTQATGTLTINADTGTPTNAQAWGLKIKSTNVQTFSWNSVFVGGDTALPTTTTGSSQIDYFTFIYDTVDSKWHFTGKATNL